MGINSVRHILKLIQKPHICIYGQCLIKVYSSGSGLSNVSSVVISHLHLAPPPEDMYTHVAHSTPC